MAIDRTLSYCRLGSYPYRKCWALQAAIQQRLIDAKRATPPEAVPHVLLHVEHPPIYTLGKSGDRDNLLVADDELASIGADFEHIDRGGDITFHGPGQIVMYPIVDLERVFTDIGRYLRCLEDAVICVLESFGLQGRRVPGRTGVWIGPDGRGPERKICAMGIRCSRWVTMHGLALNVATDLSYFGHIVPCGIDDRGVTSMQNELGEHDPSLAERTSALLASELAKALGLTLDEPESAPPFIDQLLGRRIVSIDS